MNSGLGGGLAALKEAASLIRLNRCSAAIVCTPYIMWSPFLSKEYNDMELLTFDDKCRPFDADGMYICVLFIIQETLHKIVKFLSKIITIIFLTV